MFFKRQTVGCILLNGKREEVQLAYVLIHYIASYEIVKIFSAEIPRTITSRVCIWLAHASVKRLNEKQKILSIQKHSNKKINNQTLFYFTCH